jgi:hypothetical protein
LFSPNGCAVAADSLGEFWQELKINNKAKNMVAGDFIII